MKTRSLARALQAAIVAVAPTGCLVQSSTANCHPPEHTQTIDLAEADSGVAVDAGSTCQEICQTKTGEYVVACKNVTIPATGGSHPGVECTTKAYCEGRLPAELLDEPPSRTTIAEHFAGAAFLEAASIDAFRVLAKELRAHRAPRKLVNAARRARRDEIKHTRMMRAFARRHDVATIPPRVGPPKPRDLEAIALENAVEGCVRETYGAALALWQSKRATDRDVRAAMARIARDETRHAELAWEVDRWARKLLSPESRARVEAARREAIASLARDVSHASPNPELATPDAATAKAIVEQLRASIWS